MAIRDCAGPKDSPAMQPTGKQPRTEPGVSLMFVGYRFRVTFEEMYELAVSRKSNMPDGSSTAALFTGGPHAIGKKLVEEAAESWMAARFESQGALAGELAQVLYYVACMMAEKGVSLEDVYREL